MKVIGFTFIRNAIKYDYPIQEAIQSILPLCEKVIVAVGESSDDTLSLIRSMDADKIKILETNWNDDLREGGQVLALETDKAYQAIDDDADWCFYIQGDEVVHEQYLEEIQKQMLKYQNNKNVEGLLFKYRHFYGSYDYLGDSRKWYRREIRIVRKDKNIHSWKDAQGFRKSNQKLKVKLIDAYIHHYGWVKNPKEQQLKQLTFNKLWHDDQWVKRNVEAVETFDYSNIDLLRPYKGTHPKVIQKRIEQMNWTFTFDPSKRRITIKEKLSSLVERWFDYRIGEYRNYKLMD